MFTILGGDGQEYGPATAEQVRSWIAAGRANLDTKAKVAGSEEWRALGDYPEFSGAGGVPPVMSATEANAGNDAESGTAGAPLDPDEPRPPLAVFNCLDRAFSLWRSNFFPLVGATLLIVVLQMVLNMIPILGTIAGVLLNGVFYGGLYYFYLGKMRGERREFSDLFAGFSRAFAPLMLGTVLINFLLLLVALVFFRPLISFFIATVKSGVPQSAQLPELGGLHLLGMFAGFLVITYLSTAWAFTFALIVDKRMGAWAAMEASRRIVTKQWFRVFCVALLSGLLALLGIIGLFIGLLFTLPLAFAGLLYAYEDLCGRYSSPAAGRDENPPAA